MKQVFSYFGRFTGWDKNPSSVFFLAIPLAVTAFSLLLAVAIGHARINHDYGYLITMALVLSVLGYPSYKIISNAIRVNQRFTALANKPR